METGLTITNDQIATLSGKPVMQLIKCLADNSSTDLLMFESGLTIEKAMDSMSIYKLSKGIDRVNVVKAITYLVLRMADNFNMKGKFTSEQASLLAYDLTEVLEHETLEDVTLMFKLARQGKIGDGKDFKLDGQTVLHKWVPEYLEMKAVERERLHDQSKLAHKKAFLEEIHPEVKEKLFDGIAQEPVLHDTNGNGLGSRYKKELVKAKVVTNRTDYLTSMAQRIKSASNEDLKQYLIKNDTTVEGFDPQLYEMIETELDSRNKK